MKTKSKFTVVFGKRLREFRKLLGLTMFEMAELCSKHRAAFFWTTLGNWERGECTPNPEYIQFLRTRFHLNVEWLFSAVGCPQLKPTDKETKTKINNVVSVITQDGLSDYLFRYLSKNKDLKKVLSLILLEHPELLDDLNMIFIVKSKQDLLKLN